MTNANIGNVNQPKNYDWTLSAAEAALIPAAAYAHLAIGFSAPNAKSTDSLQVDGHRARHARSLGRRPPDGQGTALHQLPALERRSPDRSEDRDQDLDHQRRRLPDLEPGVVLRVQPQHGGVRSVRLGRAAALDELHDQHPRSAPIAPRARDPERRKLLGDAAGLHARLVQQLLLHIGYAADTGRVLPHERHVDHWVGGTDLPNLHRRAGGAALHRRRFGDARRQREGQSPGGDIQPGNPTAFLETRPLQRHPHVPGAIRHQ